MVKRIKKNKGFTLIELMVAISIIIAMGAVAMVNIATYLRGGRIAQTRSNIAIIASAIDRYRYMHGELPNSLATMTAANANGNNRPLLTSDDINDAWGNTYHYTYTSAEDEYAIWSNGPDLINNSGTDMPGSFNGDDIGLILKL